MISLNLILFIVVGWYHSHPGFGCWLSGVDINTQQSFEALNARAVAVVVDPIQSVKGSRTKVLPSSLFLFYFLAFLLRLTFSLTRRQSCYRCVPSDQSSAGDDGARATSDHLQSW